MPSMRLVACLLISSHRECLPTPPRFFPSPTALRSRRLTGESIAETVRDAIGSRGAVAISRAETDEAYRR